MDELDLVYGDDEPTDRGELWSNAEQTHVISKEDGAYWVRDETGGVGQFHTFDEALRVAQERWGEVSLAPADRLRRDVAEGRTGQIGDYLLMYLSEYGAAGIDVQALAQQVLARIEED